MPKTSRPRGAAAPVAAARTQTARPADTEIARIKSRILAGLAQRDQTAGELLMHALASKVRVVLRDQALAELQREGRVESYQGTAPARASSPLTFYRLTKAASRSAKAG